MNTRAHLSRRLIAISAGGATALLLAGGAAYLYFFSAARSAPPPLVLAGASPLPATPAAPAASPASPSADPNSGLAGSYSVGPGSLAGYRVKEQFGGQTSPHEAVARTSSIAGSATVSGPLPQFQASGLKFTAELAGLSSVDQVAGFNVTNRDRLVQSSLGVSQFPTASFEAAPIQLPAGLLGGGPVSLAVPGQLTIHGVARAVQVAAQIQVVAGKVTVTGTVPVNMADYGVSPPRAPFVTAESQAIVEFQLVLAKA